MAPAASKCTVGLLLVASKAAADACPGSPSFVHAKAQVSVSFPSSSCDAVRAEMKARIAGENGWVDPHNHGTYTLLGEDASSLQAKRLTGNGQYTDLMGFTFSSSGGGCDVQGCSESQSTSVADFSTNFCNLHDLYCGSADGCPVAGQDFSYSESATTSIGASKDKSACIVKQAKAVEPVSVGKAAADACPGSPSFVHAKAQVSVSFPSSSCNAVRAEMKARIAGENGWVDPHNHGTYTLLGEDASSLQAKRLTGNGQYTDLMGFTFSSSGGGCDVHGCSESQSTSVADFSTNFCNLHDLYCGSADGCPVAGQDFSYSESATTSIGASKDKSACIVKQEAVAAGLVV